MNSIMYLNNKWALRRSNLKSAQCYYISHDECYLTGADLQAAVCIAKKKGFVYKMNRHRLTKRGQAILKLMQ